jgi:hypothetical protein
MFPRGDFHRCDDLRIGAAAAQVARQVVADVVLARIRIGGEQLPRHQHKARRAEAALKCAGFDEGILHRIEFLCGLLDRLDRGSISERRQIKAARHSFAVQHDRAAAAQTLGAALARTKQIEAALQQIDQGPVWLNIGRG